MTVKAALKEIAGLFPRGSIKLIDSKRLKGDVLVLVTEDTSSVSSDRQQTARRITVYIGDHQKYQGIMETETYRAF